MVYLKH